MAEGAESKPEEPPHLPYATLIGAFGLLLGVALAVVRRSGRSLPVRADAADIVLVGVASHKLSRLIAKDKVLRPVRAPFTELQGEGGPSELEESSRGTGFRRAIGDLLVCPYCLGLWVVTGFALGLLLAPRSTRFIAGIFSALTLSDFLQIAYKAAEEKGLG